MNGQIYLKLSEIILSFISGDWKIRIGFLILAQLATE